MKILALILTATNLVSYAENARGTASRHLDNAKHSITNAGSRAADAAVDAKNAVVEGASAAGKAISTTASSVKTTLVFKNNVANFLNKVREVEKRTGQIAAALATNKFPDAIHPEQLTDAKEVILNSWPATRAALKFSRISDGETIVFLDKNKTLGVDLNHNTIYVQYESAKGTHNTNKVGVSVITIHVDIK